MEILEQIQKSLSKNVWKPDYITLVDSDPRWRALDVIEKEKGIKNRMVPGKIQTLQR